MPADSPQKVDLFDRAFSFDPVDVAADARLTFRPLFYLDEYARLRERTEHDIDVLFVGTAHSDRYAVLKLIQGALPTGTRFERVLFMRSYVLYRMLRLFSPQYWFAKKDEFVFKSLSKSEVMALIARARIVVDIERIVQNGYTMRTVEMLGASRKLITTNPRVIEADFYSSENQLFVDRRNPKIPDTFLHCAWQPVSPELLQLYSLSGWIDEVLGN